MAWFETSASIFAAIIGITQRVLTVEVDGTAPYFTDLVSNSGELKL